VWRNLIAGAPFAGFQHVIAAIGSDGRYPVVTLANAEMEIGHQ